MTKTLISKVLKIVKIILILTFFSFSIYTSTLSQYADINWFLRYFSSPFIFIFVSLTKVSGYAFVGLIVSSIIYAFIYGNVYRDTIKLATLSKGVMKGYFDLWQIKESEKRYDALVDFIFGKEFIDFVKCGFSFSLVPLSLIAFKSIAFDSYMYLDITTNLSALWCNLNETDPYYLTSIILVLLNIVLPVINYVFSKKNEKKDVVYLFFRLSLSLLIIGVSFVNVRLSWFLIITNVFSICLTPIKRKFEIKKEDVLKKEEKATA